MEYPRSELLADDVCLRKNRSLLLLGLLGLALSVLGGWLMFTDGSDEPEQPAATTQAEF